MKLRTKLFLSVGILFSVVALGALFFENHLVRVELNETEKEFSQKIYKEAQKNRKKLTSYLTETIAGYEGEVDGFLRENQKISLLDKDRWNYLARALQGYPWIDFLSLSEGGKEYTILPSNAVLYPFTFYEEEGIIYLQEKKEYYATKKISLSPSLQKRFPAGNFYLLHKRNPTSFDRKGKSYTLERKKDPVSLEEKNLAQAFAAAYEKQNTRADLSHLAFLLTEEKKEDSFPEGIAVIYPDGEGGLLLSKELFFIFDQKEKGEEKEKYLIFSSPASHDFFLGASHKVGNKTVQVGRVISEMVEDLSLITGELVIAVHRRHYLAAQAGEKVTLTLPSFPDQKIGEVMLGGEKLFFSKIAPFPDSDLTFYLLQKKSKAFAIVDYIRSTLQSVISKVSWNLRIMGLIALGCTLFFLHRIATAVSRPITKLAHATKEVVNGHYEKMQLPAKKSNDEVGFLIDSFSEMVEGLKEREKVQGALNKVVSKEIANKLLKEEIHLGGEEREGVILFADIRDFTHHTEKMPPQEVISFLNECMTKISHIIDQHHGVIDKYVGDEVMALFGIPVPVEDSAMQAVDCAVEIQRQMEEWNRERESKGLFRIEIGIGIHKGKVVAGNMGSENRLNYTVVGSNVNLASRLCSKAGGGEILISHSMVDGTSLAQKYSFKDHDPLSLKGFSEKIPVYSLEKK